MEALENMALTEVASFRNQAGSGGEIKPGHIQLTLRPQCFSFSSTL